MLQTFSPGFCAYAGELLKQEIVGVDSHWIGPPGTTKRKLPFNRSGCFRWAKRDKKGAPDRRSLVHSPYLPPSGSTWTETLVRGCFDGLPWRLSQEKRDVIQSTTAMSIPSSCDAARGCCDGMAFRVPKLNEERISRATTNWSLRDISSPSKQSTRAAPVLPGDCLLTVMDAPRQGHTLVSSVRAAFRAWSEERPSREE